jgi:hypothetical protein
MTSDDLAALLEGLRALALTKNRIALDLYCVIEKEMLARHQTMEISDYSDNELSEVTATLACAVDASRAAGVSDDYPASKFLLLNLNALLDELERRGMVAELQ